MTTRTEYTMNCKEFKTYAVATAHEMSADHLRIVRQTLAGESMQIGYIYKNGEHLGTITRFIANDRVISLLH